MQLEVYQIMLELILLFLAIPPELVGEPFSDDDLDSNDPCGTSFKRMQEKAIQNSQIFYFLKNFPDALFYRGMVEESYPPRIHGFYQYVSDDEFTKIKLYYHPCRLDPLIIQFIYQNKAQNIFVDALRESNPYFKSSPSNLIKESLKDVTLHETHEKWSDSNNQTVYILPSHSEVLLDRGFLSEKAPWIFDTENIQKSACDTKGGMWDVWSVLPHAEYECGLPMYDSGKQCTNPIQCNGYCLAPEDLLLGDDTVGRCSDYHLVKCASQIINGKVQRELCR